MKKHVVVIGGGVAGAAACYRLTAHGYDVTILEKSDRLGGRIRSEIIDEATVEMGAGFLTGAYTNVLAFLKNVGLDEKLEQQRSNAGVLRGGKMRLATLGSLSGNGGLSWGAKMQAARLIAKVFWGMRTLDIHAFWKAWQYDTESVADMFQSPSEKEFLEYVLQPMLNGYFYWTPEQTSKAMLLTIGRALLTRRTYKLTGGLQQIPERAAQGASVLLGHSVANVQRESDGTYIVAAKDKNGKKQTLHADGVVCATTASVVPRIIADLNQAQKAFFSSIRYSSTTLMARTYDHGSLRKDRGLAFPRKENQQLAAITIATGGYSAPHRAETLKAYVSGANGNSLMKKSDNHIIMTLDGEVDDVAEDIFRIRTEPTSTLIQRWPEALPMFEVGHFHKLRRFAKGEIEPPEHALVFAGDYIGGPFIEGAFTSGIDAAERLHNRLR